MANCVGGHVDAVVVPAGVTVPQAKEGNVITLLECGGIQENGLSVPTVNDIGIPEANVLFYRILMAPSDTPTEIVELLRETFAELMTDEEYVQTCEEMSDPVLNSFLYDSLNEQFKADYAKYTELVEVLGIGA